MTRRVLIAGLMLAAACGPAAAEGRLRILNWADYTAPQVIESFQRETGTEVEVTTFATNEEAFERLRAEPGRFDLVVPDDHMIKRLAEAGMLEPIDAAAIPGFANLSSIWLQAPHDPSNAFSLPYLWGTTSFAVDIEALPGADQSLATLFDPPPAARGKLGVMAESAEAFRLAGLYLGLPRCTDQPDHLRRIAAALDRMRKAATGTYSDDLVDSIASPRHLVHMAWNGDAVRARQKRPGLRYAYPKEGVLAWLSGVAVPKGAPNRKAALAFMGFLMRPEVAAQQTNHTGYGNAILGSEEFIDPALRNAPEFKIPSSARLDFAGDCPPRVAARQQAVIEKAFPAK